MSAEVETLRALLAPQLVEQAIEEFSEVVDRDGMAPSSALDAVTLDVAKRIKSKIPQMTVDQLIRTLGHLSSMYRKAEAGGGGVQVQIINSMPAPR